MNERTKQLVLRISLAVCILLTPLLLTTASLVVDQGTVAASSHREAPLIAQDPYADNTDTYVFIPPKSPDNVVLAASWIPFEGPEGAPNYFEWGNGVLYDIYVDNDGDARSDITYTLSSRVQVLDATTYQYSTGPINENTDTTWNRRQFITITEQLENGTVNTLVGNQLTTPVNIGSKSTPKFKNLEKDAIFTFDDGTDKIKLYGGQTDDAFWVDLQVFDQLTLRGQSTQPLKPGGPPLGYAKGNNDPVDSVSGFNVHSLVIEAPISRLLDPVTGDPVLGVWSGSRRQATRVLLGAGGLGGQSNTGDYVQVSRLGTPLTNEVVLPYALKDAFNAIDPTVDAVLYTGGAGPDIQRLLQKSVEDPEVGFLLCDKYGIPLPGDTNADCHTEVQFISDPAVGAAGLRSGRGDIFDIFLTGLKLANPFTITTSTGPGGSAKDVGLPAGYVVNRPQNPAITVSPVITGVVPADMLRINTNIKGALCHPKPQRLGVLAGDACGFPNGRRLIDDMVEIEILAVVGAAYQALDGRDTGFVFNPALIGVLTDGIDRNDVRFRSSFPYMARAQSGQEHIHQNPRDDDHVNASGLDAAEAAEDEEAADESSDADALENKIYAPVVRN